MSNRMKTRQRYIRYNGDLYALPDTESEVWLWADGVNGDARLGNDERFAAGILAGLMLRAIRTGEGVVYR